jgi:predicted GIY-YIG superfamily endonuclease
MRKTTFIYGLYCPIDNKLKYIGKSNDPIARFRKHNQMCDNNHLKNEWIKHLIDNGLKPILKILEEVMIEDWKQKEKLYISSNRETLLNICGGANGLSFGNKTSFKGKPLVRVVCLDKEGRYIKTFESIKEATIFNGKSIFNVLVHKRKSSGGYLWLYEHEYKSMDENILKEFILECNLNKSVNNGINTRFSKGIKPHNSKKINQFTLDGDFIKTWEDSVEASLYYTGKRRSGINNCAIGKCKTSLGFIWRYFNSSVIV